MPSSPAARQQLRAEGLNYAQQLLTATNQVENAYFRPVSRPDLLHAALSGLYEAARVPVPRNLRTDLLRAANNETELIDLLVRCREEIGNVEALQGAQAVLESCRALTRALDPHSCIVSEEEQARMRHDGEINGIGIELVENSGAGKHRLKLVHPGSPAQKAGLRPGDEILELDRMALKGMTSAQVMGLVQPVASGMNAAAGFNNAESAPAIPLPDRTETEPTRIISLLVARPGEKPQRVKLEPSLYRAETVVGVSRNENNHWEYFVDRKKGIAQIRVIHLGKGTAEEVRAVVHRLKGDGLRGLILDLRWCPGGYLVEAVQIAGLFLNENIIVRVQNRGDSEQKYTNSVPGESRVLDLPLVVLVNGETSGGAELIAAALQDYNRAQIAGQRSLGKASVQTTLYVNLPGNTMKLTTGTFLRPSGKNLHRFADSKLSDNWGIQPEKELEFRLTRELGQQLKGWWDLHSLRPGKSTERLPLDDPASDPQRAIAVEGLQRRLEQVRR